MKSTRLVGFAALLLGVGVVSFAGCDDEADGTGGATSSSSSTGKASSSGGMVTVSASSSSGMSGDGNDTFATATVLEADADGVFASPNMDPDIADLTSPDVDVDFYKIDAKKGPMFFGVNIHPTGQSGLAEGYIDSVLTIYDSNMAQIAQNDDRFPRTTTDSELFTILPADGTYYIKVEEFCESTLSGGMCPSDYFDNILYNQYVVFGIPLAADMGNIPEGPEPNDTGATATPLTYAPVPMMAGSYYLSLAFGTLTPNTDSDWFKFTPPADVMLDPDQRLSIDFVNPPGTIDGNGSDVKVGVVQIIDSADMSVYAQLDFTNEPSDPNRTDMSGVPVIAGHDYFLKVPFGAKAANGQGAFYFMEHGIGGGNPVEAQELTNNLPATPEVLQIPAMSTGYFVEGDIAAGDLDHFKVATNGQPSLAVACGAQRSGSGLRNLKAEVLKADGITPIAMGSATETATMPINLDVDVTGNTDVVIKLTATQDATVKSTFYRCGIYPQATPMP